MADIFNTVRQQNSTAAAHGNWTVLSIEGDHLKVSGTGNGVDSLRNFLQDDGTAFVLLTLRLELEAIPDQPRNIFIHWTGPKASGMKKVKSNQKMSEALNLLSPNHGQLVAQGKTEFTEDIIRVRWNPSSGSHLLS
eukprot:TRINITY_DN3289_c0_g1_i1.p1 TRINITY_DN3289_c0_g1~~TRINITY_DN3289_c0_g1_i1.p1  ORF type:complete len:136 (+),score=40.56 TRINITY_DN3289_c0_g1_i1:63-470(+)